MDPLRVLILEDDEDIIELVRSLLEPVYECITAADGEEGLRMAAEGEPDLLICDIMMPVMDGWEFMRRLRAMPGFEKTPVIFLTALSSQNHIRDGYNLGVALYLTKPINPARLKRNIELFIDDHGVTPRPKKKRPYQLKRAAQQTEASTETSHFLPKKAPAPPKPSPTTRPSHVTPTPPPRPAAKPADPSDVNFTLVSHPTTHAHGGSPPRPASTPKPAPKPAAETPRAPEAPKPAPQPPRQAPPEPPPMVFGPEKQPKPEAPKTPQGTPEQVRIMVVDDDSDTCKMLYSGLQTGYEVLVADDGITAIEWAIRYKPDIFIIDGMLPRMTGYQLSVMLKKNREFYRSPIIFISGKATTRDQQYVRSLGIKYFLAKPFNIKAIKIMIEEAMHEADFTIHKSRPEMAQIQLEHLQRFETHRTLRPSTPTLDQIERQYVENTLKKQL